MPARQYGMFITSPFVDAACLEMTVEKPVVVL